MIACYVLSSDWGFRCVFAGLGGVIELSPHNAQASGHLFPVESIIANEKGFLALGDNELRDIHIWYNI